MKRYLVIALSILLVVSLLFIGQGCEKKSIVKIGVLTPLTGEVASWGKIQQNATELAIEKVNKEGGVKGVKVKAIYEDDKASPKEGVTAFKKLYEVDKVAIVVGSPASNVTLAIAPVANKMHKVLLSSGSTSMEVGKAGPYIFRIMPSDEVQAKIMSDWAWELGYREIAIVYVENSWGRGLMNEFKLDFERRGGRIVAVQSSSQSETDFRDKILNIKKSNPDAIYAPLYSNNAGIMIRQARELGLKQQILGADVYGTPDLIAAGGDAVNGVLYTTFSAGKGKLYSKFVEKYKIKYGKEPETYALYCYDTFLVAVEALRNADDFSGENIRRALLSINNFYGVTGLTSFEGNNSASGKTFDKWIIRNRNHVKIK